MAERQRRGRGAERKLDAIDKVDSATLLSLRPALGGAGAMSWVRAGLAMAEGQSVSWALLTKVDGATLLSLRSAEKESKGATTKIESPAI